MPNFESEQLSAAPAARSETLFESVAPSLAGPQESSRRVGAPESRTTIRIGRETFWDLAHEKYDVSGSAQVDAMLAILELNGLNAKLGKRNGKSEWTAETYYAGKDYQLPAQSEIPALVRAFHERMANGGQAPGKVLPPQAGNDQGGTVPGKPPVAGTDKVETLPGKPQVGTDKVETVPGKPQVGTDKVETVPGNPQVGTDKVETVPGNPGTDKVETAPANDLLLKSAAELEKRHQQQVAGLTSEIESQGWLGRFWDNSKESVGGSSKSDKTMSRLWSYVVDSDSSSKSVGEDLRAENAKIAELKKAAAANDQASFKNIYRDLTGQEFDPQKLADLQSKVRVGDYKASQEAGVDGIANLGSLTAALLLTRRFTAGKNLAFRSVPLIMGADAAATGGFKAAIKGTDQRYADLKYDLASGAALGALAAPSELVGTLATRGTASALKMKVTGNLLTERISTEGAGLGTRSLSAFAKYGVTGGAFGGSAPVVQEAVSSQYQGRPFDTEAVKHDSLVGLGTGLTLGTGMGFLIGGKGPARDVRTPRQIVNEQPVAPATSEVRPPAVSSEVAAEVSAPPKVKVHITGQNPDAVLRLKDAVSAGIKSDPELARLLIQQNDEWVAGSLDDAFKAQKLIDVMRNQLMPKEKLSVGVSGIG